MNFNELSVEDQELLRAFIEIARGECGERSWAEVEPTLASYWERSHRKSSELQWQEVAIYVHSACDMVAR